VGRLIRSRYGLVAWPPQLKRGQVIELEAGELQQVLQAAGMAAAGQGGGRDNDNARRAQQPEQELSDAPDGDEQGDFLGNGAYAAPFEDSDEVLDEVDGNRAPAPVGQHARAPGPGQSPGQNPGNRPGRRGRRRRGGGNQGGNNGGGRGGNNGGNRGGHSGNPGGNPGGNRGGGHYGSV